MIFIVVFVKYGFRKRFYFRPSVTLGWPSLHDLLLGVSVPPEPGPALPAQPGPGGGPQLGEPRRDAAGRHTHLRPGHSHALVQDQRVTRGAVLQLHPRNSLGYLAYSNKN